MILHIYLARLCLTKSASPKYPLAKLIRKLDPKGLAFLWSAKYFLL